MQAVGNDARLLQVGVRHDQQVAVVVGRAEQVRTTSLLTNQLRDGLLDGLAQIAAVEVGQVRDAVDLQQHDPHGNAVAAGARKLVLHQVQDLRLREQRTAQEAVAIDSWLARPSRAAFAEAWSRHL